MPLRRSLDPEGIINLFIPQNNNNLKQFSIVLIKYFFADHSNSEVCLALYRQSLKSKEMDHDGTHFDAQYPHTFIILGASVS